jgi:hypothetical protein
MVTAGTQFLPNIAAHDVRTEAIVTAAILLGVASLLRRNVIRQM